MNRPCERDAPAPLRALVAPYARPDRRKALWQLTNTLPPFVGLWVLTALTLEWSHGWSLLLLLPIAGFYVRLFIIQHDCGHGSFFASARWNHRIGAVLGMITFFPYRVLAQDARDPSRDLGQPRPARTRRHPDADRAGVPGLCPGRGGSPTGFIAACRCCSASGRCTSS